MRVIVAAIVLCIAAMIVMAPHAPQPTHQPAATSTVVDTPLPTQDCMNAVAGDSTDAPTQDCLTSIS